MSFLEQDILHFCVVHCFPRSVHRAFLFTSVGCQIHLGKQTIYLPEQNLFYFINGLHSSVYVAPHAQKTIYIDYLTPDEKLRYLETRDGLLRLRYVYLITRDASISPW